MSALLKLLSKQENEPALNEYVAMVRGYEAQIKDLKEIINEKNKDLNEILGN